MGEQLTAAQKFKQAAFILVSHLKQVIAEGDAEKLVEDFVQAAMDGIVDGIELVSPPLLVPVEKMVLPWAEKKAIASADGLIETLFAKVAAKPASSPAPSPEPTRSPEGAAGAINAL